MSLFQSDLRKQIRNLPKILNFVKIIQYYSKLFTGVLTRGTKVRVLAARASAALAAPHRDARGAEPDGPARHLDQRRDRQRGGERGNVRWATKKLFM